MESKLLYDMFCLCVLTKEEIISYIEQKDDKYFENIDYYDILYPKNQDEKTIYKKSIQNMLHRIFGWRIKEKI